MAITNYHSVQFGSAIRRVHCEKCDCEYEYELIRRSDAYTSTLLPFGKNRLQVQADKESRQKLEKMMNISIDPVACPDCGWFQANMVREIRRRRLRPLIWIGVVPPAIVAVFAGTFLGLMALGAMNGLEKEDVTRLWLSLIAAIALFSLCIGLRIILNRRLNPNAGYPDIVTPFRGAPTARRMHAPVAPAPVLSPEASPKGILGYERPRPDVARGGWITVQLARITFPKLCCNCMAPTENFYGYFVRKSVVIKARLCDQCSRRERNFLGICILIGIAISLVFTMLACSWVVGGINNIVVRILVMFLFVLGIGMLMGFYMHRILARFSTTALTFKKYNPELHSISIRFRNQAYTNLFLDTQNASSDP